MSGMTRSIPSIDFRLATSDVEEERQQFVREVGDALKDIGFFALTNHGIPRSLVDDTYAQCDAFFDLDEATKRLYLQPDIGHQRGYTAFGVEHAKDNPAPDLKEFWQTGRAIRVMARGQPTHKTCGPRNTWKDSKPSSKTCSRAWNRWRNTFLPLARSTSVNLVNGCLKCRTKATPSCE